MLGDKARLARKISQLAGRQWGHVTRAQLLELGVGRSSIDRRVGRGELIRVHAGVYAVGHPRPEARAKAAAAVLACGPGAVLSHESAAPLWGFRSLWPARPEVIVPGDRRPPGVRTHRTSTLRRRDVRRHHGIRVTSPARTLNDIARRLTPAELTRAVNDARLEAGLRGSELEGWPQLRALTDEAPTRSVFEDAFLVFCQRFALPTPQINVRVAGYEVDVLFAEQKLIIELDGYRYHQGPGSFERDRERDAATLAAGYETIRLTWKRLLQAPEREAARLLSILGKRGYPSYGTLPSL